MSNGGYINDYVMNAYIKMILNDQKWKINATNLLEAYDIYWRNSKFAHFKYQYVSSQ
jgi:competence protein ComGF